MAGKTIASQPLAQASTPTARISTITRILQSGLVREVAAMGMLLGVAFLVLSIASFDPADTAAVWPRNAEPANLGGRMGAWLISVLYTYFGVATYFIGSLLGIWAAVLFFRRDLKGWPLKFTGALLAIAAFAGFFGGSANGSLSMPSSGGVVGTAVFDLLSSNVGLTGTYLTLTFIVAISVLLATDILFFPLIRDFFTKAGQADNNDEISEVVQTAFERQTSAAGIGGLPAADEAASPRGKRAQPGPGAAAKLLRKLGFKSTKNQQSGDGTMAMIGGLPLPRPAISTNLPGAQRANAISGVTEIIENTDDTDSSASTAVAEVEDVVIPADKAGLPSTKGAKAKPLAPATSAQAANIAAAAPIPVAPSAPKKGASVQIDPEVKKKLHAEQAAAFKIPEATLLSLGKKADLTNVKREIERNAEIIVATCREFKIDVDIVDVKRGPTITLYELKIPPNMPVKKITQLEDNLCMMLEAVTIRILAPIPGRSTVGIEVPNRVRDLVSLREVIASQEFADASRSMQLPLALGLDAEGKPLVRDLVKTPHLLISGTTGSGKSVLQNVILMSLLLSRHYRDVRLMLVDPKMVELTPYEELGYLITPVITDSSKAVTALEWLVEEMEKRYTMFAQTRTKKITEFNEMPFEERKERISNKGGDADEVPEHLPYIVAMIDELADLMQVAADTSADELIQRIAQKARAAGIHLILATQRPSSDVITGTIKTNIPARIGLKSADATASRIIINDGGAEKLLPNGDMLVNWGDGNNLLRAQSAFVDNKEIEKICEEIRRQATPQYLVEHKQLATANASDEMIGGQPRHEMLDAAIEQVLTHQRGSAQFLRSALRIGYNAATTIVMQMEQLGILGPARGSKEREILMTLDEWRGRNGQPVGASAVHEGVAGDDDDDNGEGDDE